MNQESVRRLSLLAGLVAALLSAAVLADCIEGMRDPTPGENQYYKRVSAMLKEALPPAPANWTMAPGRDATLGGFCKGDREGEFDVRVSGIYTFRPSKAESDRIYAESRAVQKEIDALRQLPPEVAKERQGWLDKMSEANRASNAAAKQGDRALARQKDQEAEEYSRKGRAVRDTYWASVQPKVDQLTARQKTLNYGSTEVRVSIIANEFRADPPNPQTGVQFVAGKVPAPRGGGLKVLGVRAVVEGPAPKRGEIEAALDREKLRRLVP